MSLVEACLLVNSLGVSEDKSSQEVKLAKLLTRLRRLKLVQRKTLDDILRFHLP